MKIEELINEYYSKLNENDHYILKYVLNNKSSCYELGINDLASKCNVSRSSILRLAQKLGFSGYSEFRVFLKWQDQEKSEKNINCIETFNSDLQETLKYAQNRDFEDICQLLDNAKRIFVYGTGTAQLNCAFELQRMFLAIGCHLHVIQANRELEMVLTNLTKEDVVIMISLSGDTPTLFFTVQALVAKGVPIVSVTNLNNNKLARMTPYNLYANSSTTRLSNGIKIDTFASFFIIAETLFRHYSNYCSNKEMHIQETEE